MKFLKVFFLSAFIFSTATLQAQDSLDVTFRYTPNESAVRVFVPGEFNNWGPNSSGVIDPGAVSLMERDFEHGFWYKKVRLEVGGGTSSYQGASGYAYKFHEHYDASGSEWQWFTDPLNPIAIGQNNDSFVEITHPLVFQMSPSENSIHQDTPPEFWANVAARASDSIDVQASQVFINENLLTTFEGYYEAGRQLLHIESLEEFDVSLNYGTNEFKIVAVTEGGATLSDSAQFSFLSEPEIVDEARPQGLGDGITYSDSDPTKVSLSLFAPGKEFVFVIGDFNNWSVNVDYQMKRDSVSPDSIWFWTEITGLTPGQEYAFQYLVDGELRIADPYSELVLDPGNDEFISESTYPDLKAYPQGETTGYVGVFQTGQEEYTWTATDYERPSKDELVIYELLIRDFIESHNYQTLTDTLDYLENLGVTAIELMPVNEFEGNISWGYNPSFHMALDKYYGPKDEFKKFIDEAHSRGIAVILDVVMNHAFGQNSLVRLWNEGDFGRPLPENPYLNVEPKHDYNVGYDFNHASSATQYYLDRVTQYWIDEYNIDGYRFDLSKGFTQKNTLGDTGAWGEYDAGRIAILKRMADHIWSVDPETYVILEHFAQNSEEQELSSYGMMLWGNENAQYNEATMGYNSDLSGILAGNRGFTDRHLVGYMESHDEQWLMFKNIAFGNSRDDYDVTEFETAFDRQELAGAFFFTLPGPKMIWQFGELGYGYGDEGEQCLNDHEYCPSFAPGRTDPKPIRWDYFEEPGRKDIYNTWSKIMHLRKSTPAFTEPDNSDYSLAGTFKEITLSHTDTDVVVVGNFGVAPSERLVSFTQDGTWYDYFGESEITVSGMELIREFAPGEFKIYTTKQFELPVSREEEIHGNIPSEFKLSQNYPNPFNPTTVISYQLPENSLVRLEVFDVMGRKVQELVDARQAAGNYSVTFNAQNLSSGIYFARLTAGSFIHTQKMTLVK